jgi:hypothetical protein
LNGSDDVPLHRLQTISGLGFLASRLTITRALARPTLHQHQYQRHNDTKSTALSWSKMVIIDGVTGEPDVARLFTVLSELMEQTNSHRSYTAQLHAQASGIKVCTAILLPCSW